MYTIEIEYDPNNGVIIVCGICETLVTHSLVEAVDDVHKRLTDLIENPRD